jgi:hypothetical protein
MLIPIDDPRIVQRRFLLDLTMDEKHPTPEPGPLTAQAAVGLDPVALIVAAVCAAGWLLLFVLTCFHS